MLLYISIDSQKSHSTIYLKLCFTMIWVIVSAPTVCRLLWWWRGPYSMPLALVVAVGLVLLPYFGVRVPLHVFTSRYP